MKNTNTQDKPLIIEVDNNKVGLTNWVLSEYKSITEMKKDGYKFEYADLEDGYTILVLSRNGYLDRFRIVGRGDLINA